MCIVQQLRQGTTTIKLDCMSVSGTVMTPVWDQGSSLGLAL